MTPKQSINISKYLSKHLRHNPERLGLSLEPGGWVSVDELLDACRRHQFAISREQLDYVVKENDKQRFSFDETGQRIRANQGHSTEVDLQLQPQTPPDILFHGTGKQIVPIILKDGLKKMNRHHVHLTADIHTAIKTGSRKGKPVVLKIDAAAMMIDDFVFYCSDNNVWLTDHVPAHYLEIDQEN